MSARILALPNVDLDDARRGAITPAQRRVVAEAARVEAAGVRRAANVRFHASKRRVVALNRRPPWADMEAIRAIYLKAQRLTRDTGVPHHVDHDIPLQGKLVSGLHVHNNLQILTGSANSKKRNRFEIEP